MSRSFSRPVFCLSVSPSPSSDLCDRRTFTAPRPVITKFRTSFRSCSFFQASLLISSDVHDRRYLCGRPFFLELDKFLCVFPLGAPPITHGHFLPFYQPFPTILPRPRVPLLTRRIVQSSVFLACPFGLFFIFWFFFCFLIVKYMS